jgi:uncharacterized OsmC-like protein
MPTRKATARWEGTLKEGRGHLNGQSGLDIRYAFSSRFEDGPGSNPEELLAAAHAGCYSMALNAGGARLQSRVRRNRRGLYRRKTRDRHEHHEIETDLPCQSPRFGCCEIYGNGRSDQNRLHRLEGVVCCADGT